MNSIHTAHTQRVHAVNTCAPYMHSLMGHHHAMIRLFICAISSIRALRDISYFVCVKFHMFPNDISKLILAYLLLRTPRQGADEKCFWRNLTGPYSASSNMTEVTLLRDIFLAFRLTRNCIRASNVTAACPGPVFSLHCASRAWQCSCRRYFRL